MSTTNKQASTPSESDPTTDKKETLTDQHKDDSDSLN